MGVGVSYGTPAFGVSGRPAPARSVFGALVAIFRYIYINIEREGAPHRGLGQQGVEAHGDAPDHAWYID